MDARKLRCCQGTAMLAVWAACGALACDTAFIEPNPPVLVAGSRTVEPQAIAEPVVYGAILDLQIPDPSACAAARTRVEETLRAVALATGAPVHALATRELAPGCAQQSSRSLDVDALDSEIRAVEAKFRGSAVRPVLLYVNNVELPLPFTVTAGLETLRSRASYRGAPRTIVNGLAQSTWYGFDARIPWTWSQDEAMWRALEAHQAAILPLRSLSATAPTVPLLEGELAGRAVAVKVCGLAGGANLSPWVPLGVAAEPGALQVVAWFYPYTAQPRNAVPSALAAATFEACVDRCDRFLDLDGGLERWSEHLGCVVEGSR